MNFWKILVIKIKNAYYLLFRNATQVQMYIQELKRWQRYDGSETLLSIQSYTELKNYQRKFRLFVFGAILAAMLALAGLIWAFITIARFIMSTFNH
jgi:hypothetical protein